MKILFVCTGNTCRSPMAEYFAKKYIEDNNLKDYEFDSAGINARVGQGASSVAIEVMEEIGIDLSGHKAKMLREEDLKENDKIFTMTNNHRKVIQDMYDHDNIYNLKYSIQACENCDILDPYGFGIEKYRETRDEIKHTIKELFTKLKRD